jgi:tRNA-splicing ligase RtcB
MRTSGLVFASEKMLRVLEQEQALEQVCNVASLPGIVGPSIAMPDLHWGYGFPIGGVAAFDPEEGVVSPGGVGYDINCGVRLLRSRLTVEELAGWAGRLADTLFRNIPAGVGSERRDLKLSRQDQNRVLTEGAGWVVSRGLGSAGDLDRLAAIHDRAAAAALGLFPDQVTVTIHTGSRGLGHQVCDDYLRVMHRASRAHGIELPDRQLCCAPLASPEGEEYLAAMACAANFAFANRQLITAWVRESFEQVFGTGPAGLDLSVVYDVCHNIAKWETHPVAGTERRLCVHRKGATRAFPPGHPDVPAAYRAVGQPVLIPGDMGRYSYVLVGTRAAAGETFGSTCHGAGRLLSRNAARKEARGRRIAADLAGQGILVRAASGATLAEEIPAAYKDVAEVVGVVEAAGIGKIVARLRPLIVVKG